MAHKITVVYVTSSQYKREENSTFVQACRLSDNTPVADLFAFDLRHAQIKEVLEVDIAAMVCSEVVEAYCQLKVPCIVEHAGLVFDDYYAQTYPGGLTKPMWNALGSSFIKETQSAGRRVTARAVIAYCDGHEVKTFVGEVKGRIADTPRGSRKFYWDTIFVPDNPDGTPGPSTYAEIVEDPQRGLSHKVRISQSTSAMLQFLEYRRKSGLPALWDSMAP